MAGGPGWLSEAAFGLGTGERAEDGPDCRRLGPRDTTRTISCAGPLVFNNLKGKADFW